MRTDTHKEWTDAFRESFPEEVRPADGGWEAVAGRVRRAAARRRAAIAAAALALPLAGGVLFLSRPNPGEPLIEVQDTPGLVAQIPEPASESPVLREATSEHGSATNGSPVLENANSEHASLANEPPVLREAESEHAGTANHPPVLREADSEHGSAANGSPVLEKAYSEHASLANEPPVLREAESEHGGGIAFPEEEVAPAYRRAHRLTAGLMAGSVAGGAPTTVTVSSMAGGLATKASNLVSNNFLSNDKGSILNKEYVHDLPLSFGLTARYSLTDRLSVESGLEYTYLHSRLDDIHTVMHFAGIPLRVDYSLFSAGPVEFYTGLGGKVEKCLKATLGGVSVPEDKLQWSASLHLGTQARLSRNAWLYIQPDISYYFTKTSLSTYRTENRLGLTVRGGIRFDLNH